MEKEKKIGISFSQTEENPQLSLCEISGYVDSYNAKHFQTTLSNYIKSGAVNIIMDCSELNYLSSAGIGSFVAVADEIKNKGFLILFGIQPKVLEVFTLLGFNNFFNICSAYDDAFQKAQELLSKKTQPVLTNIEAKIVFPFIFECNACGKKLRVSHAGRYRCPSCQSDVEIDKQGKVTYL